MRGEDMPHVSISNYGNYSNSNYGAHCMEVRVGSMTLCFSYNTVVAFSDGFGGLKVSQNNWGPTTGKHLNWIDGGDKSSRLPREEFNRQLDEALKRHDLVVD
jgi:hypothetical protein